MALNQEEYLSLQDAGLCQLYNGNKEVWNRMAKDAYNYIKGYLPSTVPVRPDDVVKAFVPAISIDLSFRNHMQSKKLRQKYWPIWFADLILDTCFTENVFGGEST